MKKWTKEEVELLKSEYWQGKPEELCVLFNRDWESIRAKAFRENIKRDKSFAFRYSKGKSTIDEKFFKNWSHEMAYILGFITADGCIFENRLMFTLHLQDVDILYKIANCLGENINIYKYKKTCRMSIRSDVFRDDLLKLGITPNKTFTVTPPEIPLEFMKSYIRGIHDGDGCINIRKGKTKDKIRVSFKGNEYVSIFLRDTINKLVNSNCNIYPTKTKNGFSYTLQYSDNKALKFLEWIYDEDCSIYLDRKYAIYKNFIF